MHLDRRALFRHTAGAAAAFVFPPAVTAAPYPPHPVRILVGFPAGGPLDIVARTIAPVLSSRLGADFTVQNRPGASGNLATAEVVQSSPDGRTLLLCGPVNVINTALFTGLDFDFERDILAVALIASVPLVVEVNPSVPVRSIAELIALAKSKPGLLKVAFAGVGTPQHIAIELFQRMAGVKVMLVPYAGSADALAALLEGRADAMFDPAPSSIAHIRAGRLVPLATTGATRSEMLPDVAALAETIPGYEASSWFGLGTPRGTPRRIVDSLNAAVNDGLADASIRARLRDLGATALPGSPAAFGHFIAREAEKYRRIILAAGIKPT